MINKILVSFIVLILASGLYAKVEPKVSDNKKVFDEVFELLKHEKYTKAYDKLLILANDGEAQAMLAIGNLHYHGKGAQQNYKEAFKWYKKALNKGNQPVKYILANMYKDGIGTQKAYHIAFDLYLQSAMQTDNAKAMFFVSAMYYHGEGTRRDFKKAIYWSKKAVEQREPRAAFLLGLAYLNGHGVKKDLDKAFHYASMSQSLGNTQAPKLVEMIKKANLKTITNNKSK